MDEKEKQHVASRRGRYVECLRVRRPTHVPGNNSPHPFPSTSLISLRPSPRSKSRESRFSQWGGGWKDIYIEVAGGKETESFAKGGILNWPRFSRTFFNPLGSRQPPFHHSMILQRFRNASSKTHLNPHTNCE